MQSIARAFIVATLSGLYAPWTLARASPPPASFLFLIQQRCDVPTALPGDPACRTMRPVEPGEDPLYRLSNGAEGEGRIDMVNLPIERHGKWRVVSPDAHVNVTDATTGIKGGVSVEGVGARFLSVLGSWSPVAVSHFTNAACDAMPDNSDRFLDSWVLGPAQDGTAMAGHGETRSGNLTRHEGETDGPGCPARLRKAAYSWIRQDYTYRSGRRFPSLVSVHYSAASPQGGPGEAEQRERLYLAWGLGLARWEKWSREDWRNPKTGETALDQARRVFVSGRCNTPIDDRDQGDGVTYGAVSSDGTYAETIRTAPNSPAHRWVLTQCQDYTSLRAGPTRDLQQMSAGASSEFWR